MRSGTGSRKGASTRWPQGSETELHQGAPHPLLPCVTSRSGAGQGAPVSTLLSPEGQRLLPDLTPHLQQLPHVEGAGTWIRIAHLPGHSQAHHKEQRTAGAITWLGTAAGAIAWLGTAAGAAAMGRPQGAAQGWVWEGKEASPEAPRGPLPFCGPLHPMGGPSCPHSSVLKVTLPHCPKDSSQIPPELRRALFRSKDSALLVGFY